MVLSENISDKRAELHGLYLFWLEIRLLSWQYNHITGLHLLVGTQNISTKRPMPASSDATGGEQCDSVGGPERWFQKIKISE